MRVSYLHSEVRLVELCVFRVTSRPHGLPLSCTIGLRSACCLLFSTRVRHLASQRAPPTLNDSPSLPSLSPFSYLLQAAKLKKKRRQAKRRNYVEFPAPENN